MALNHTVFGSLMLRRGEANALVGAPQHYPDVIRPALQIISVRPGLNKVCGVYVVITPQGDIYFLADTTVNVEPSAEDAERSLYAPPKWRAGSDRNRGSRCSRFRILAARATRSLRRWPAPWRWYASVLPA